VIDNVSNFVFPARVLGYSYLKGVANVAVVVPLLRRPMFANVELNLSLRRVGFEGVVPFGVPLYSLRL
jgi:hypothetical protein